MVQLQIPSIAGWNPLGKFTKTHPTRRFSSQVAPPAFEGEAGTVPDSHPATVTETATDLKLGVDEQRGTRKKRSSHSATQPPPPPNPAPPNPNPKPKGNLTHWATQSLYQSGWSEIFANAHSIVKSRTEAPKFGEQKYSEMMTHQLVFTMDAELLAENDKLKWTTKIGGGIGVETRIPALSSTMLR